MRTVSPGVCRMFLPKQFCGNIKMMIFNLSLSFFISLENDNSAHVVKRWTSSVASNSTSVLEYFQMILVTITRSQYLLPILLIYSSRVPGIFYEGGRLLLELNRVLRPGGFFVWSATPVYQKLEEDVQIWKGNKIYSPPINKLSHLKPTCYFIPFPHLRIFRDDFTDGINVLGARHYPEGQAKLNRSCHIPKTQIKQML